MSDTTNFNELKSLLEWVNQSGDIEELSIKYGDIELALSKTPGGLSHLKAAPAAAPAAPAPAAPEAPKAEAPAPAPAEAETPAPAPKEEAPKPQAAPASSGNGVEVKSPMVGTFYAAPKPGADPFVKVGDTVEVGQVLCIVEVMKLMNNIEAKTAGTVTEILVDNEDAVEHGQTLMVIEPK
ncbi:acetyl-CoA carboxylase biotin carboxyl carrier protein [Corynebacterium afermentans subsp. lipophilum]|uniref:acetyl-CoA carboxylase biotin carboxyl carrier protein n=1 Tax=Corynebacterium afermentans TaxID=38286 RepID=UPI00188C14EE|nr:acetyl-CoA carboxylase biotin carboxyl carrier protein [Corynebacterium afermentans]MBF4548349.1 acetyl-CoA carboxylase biotin carboxyl carrier protein [Corynebacterium afermentans subsp. lipophilum]WJY58366.1 Biotin carboxyl carrier protein of acetyl-CoA carboxylase [Corynebacterium afermentans subsp. lipophilum]